MLANHSVVFDAIFCFELFGVGEGTAVHPDFFAEANGDFARAGVVRGVLRGRFRFENGFQSLKVRPVAGRTFTNY